jgi:hypothetical protein
LAGSGRDQREVRASAIALSMRGAATTWQEADTFLTNCCVESTMRTGYEKGYNVGPHQRRRRRTAALFQASGELSRPAPLF